MTKAIPEERVSPRPRHVAKDVDEYIAGIPAASRRGFHSLRSAIRSVVPPEATEVISYGIPAFKTKKVLVWFAAFAQHCSLFPTASVIAQFKDELKEFTVSKGTIQFPAGKPLPIRLVKKLVRARVAQDDTTAEGKPKSSSMRSE